MSRYKIYSDGQILDFSSLESPYFLSRSKRKPFCVWEPGWPEPAAEGENNTVLSLSFLVDCKGLTSGLCVVLMGTTVPFVPRTSGVTASTHLSSLGHSVWASSNPHSKGLYLTFSPDKPTKGNCEDHLWGSWAEITKWRRNKDMVLLLRSWLPIRPGVKHCLRVAQSASKIQSCGFSQLHHLKHQECLLSDGKKHCSLAPQKKKSKMSVCAQWGGWRSLLNLISSVNFLNESICICFPTEISF